MRALVLLIAWQLGACSGVARLEPMPWAELDPDGREVAVAYWTAPDVLPPPGLDVVTGRLIAAESSGLYLLEENGAHVHLPWAAIRAVLVPEPDLPRFRPRWPLRRSGAAPIDAVELARRTRSEERATVDDRIRLARLSRFPAGRPPSWRSRPWRPPPALQGQEASN